MNILVIPYRDAYFWNNYGTSVRDLQIINLLSKSHDIIFINRPVSIYERLLSKSKDKSVLEEKNNIKFIDNTSFDIIGPFKKRLWTIKCYNKYIKDWIEYLEEKKQKYIILDFSPFMINEKLYDTKYGLYWYDLIDNFTKHNRFSSLEKKAVSSKYKIMNERADFITGVSSSSISSFSNQNTKVLPNGVYVEDAEIECISNENRKFDLGFVGFVTDKFDVDLINELSKYFSIAIWGEFFDSSIEKKLSNNIKVFGRFKYYELSGIMSKFQVGLLPYLREKSHDESPLKMYEYFKNAKPCISSMNFEIDSKYFLCYEGLDIKQLVENIKKYKIISGNSEIKNEIKSEWILENKLNKMISHMGIL